MTETIRAGDQVLLALEDGKTFLIRIDRGKRHSSHRGTVDHDNVIGRDWGTTLTLNTGAAAFLLRPRWIDKMMKVHRRTNIMYPKDVAFLLADLDLGPGSRVIEIGSGSGAMTQALVGAVLPGGAVFSYDRREDFLELAERNCRLAGVRTGVEFRARGAGEELEPDVDAVFCDIPEPWVELQVIGEALRGSGRFAAADSEELERSIHSTGFFRQKAKSLKNCCTRLVQEHGGEVPTSMEALTALPGVGRKTANVIRAVAFGLPGIAVDTHCKRLSNRLELAVSTDPARIEACLARLYPESRWADVSRLFIWHGRYTCKARRPLCEQCSLADLCPFYHARDTESISCRPK